MESNRLSSPESITAKTSSERLKRSIARRRRAKILTQLFDHSVPSTHLFRGILRSPETAHLCVHTGSNHALSPFIIHLKQPQLTPQEILAQEQWRPIRLNLLVPESHLRRVEDVLSEKETNDLHLDETVIREQLEEDLQVALPISRWSLPSISFPTLHRKADGRFTSETAFAPLSIETFTPPKAPENLLSYFDFPEFDEERSEEDEPEHLLLDAIEEQLGEEDEQEEPKAVRTPWKFSFPTLNLPRLSLPQPFSFTQGWYRPLGAFVLLSFLFTLPIHAMNVVNDLREAKQDIETSGQNALGQLEAGASAVLIRDGASAANAFSQATDEFSAARERIQDLGAGTSLLLSALPATQQSYKSGKHLVQAGEALSVAGERLADGFVAMTEELTPTPTSRMKLLSTYADSALPYLLSAQEHLKSVKASAVPEDQAAMLEELNDRLPVLIASLEEFVQFTDMLAVILGDTGTKRYLVIFQNNTEIRPTGGFMGSFAEISVTDGQMTNMSVPGGGTYDLQGSLSTYTIAPKPLQLLKARWEFQDANWFADFPTSARQMLDFYADAGGPTVDGVIAVNATYVASLFSLLGPIEIPEYGRTVNAENFVFETQKIVELEYDKEENKPKAFIGELAPLMLDRAMEKTEEDFLSLIDYLNKGLVERDIQIYFTNDSLQREMTRLGWDGRVRWTAGDYLMVVDTNLGGGKTDGVIEQDVNVVVNIAEDGEITNTVTITRTHHGIGGALFSGVNNVDYLRIYVPKGSELLEANGFSIPDESLFDYALDGWSVDDDLLYVAETESTDPISNTSIWEESGKTVFGNWVQTKPGTASVATFTYRLPFTIEALEKTPSFFEKVKSFIGFPSTEGYNLTIQKQSGVLDRTTNITVQVPESLKTLWSSHDLVGAQVTNQTDAFFAALFEHALPSYDR